MSKHKGTRNWHAVNAFQRHAGPMNSHKREDQRERAELDKELEDMKAECKGTKLLSEIILEHPKPEVDLETQHAWHLRALMYEQEIEALENQVENFREGYDDYREECNKLKNELSQSQANVKVLAGELSTAKRRQAETQIEELQADSIPREEIKTVTTWILEQITKKT